MPLDSERERIVEELSAHFAEDHLSTQELEERFDRAYRATNSAELSRVVSDLPALAQPVRAPQPVARSVAVTTAPANRNDSRRHFALMSTFRREGEWTPHRVNVVRGIMAEVKIDLRDATFVDREIEFDLFALMADVEILVPPGVRVECDGVAIMGEFSGRHDEYPLDPDAPTVRITGTAVMGQVLVETRLPGESKGLARRRRKQLERGRA